MHTVLLRQLLLNSQLHTVTQHTGIVDRQLNQLFPATFSRQWQ